MGDASRKPPILTRLADWRRRRHGDRAAAKAEAERADVAVAMARGASESSYPGRQILDRHRTDAVEDSYIVTLLHGATRPPGRSWWHVDRSAAITELPYDKAAMHIQIPMWR